MDIFAHTKAIKALKRVTRRVWKGLKKAFTKKPQTASSVPFTAGRNKNYLFRMNLA